MKKYFNAINFLLLVLMLNSCSNLQVKADEKYQPLGTAVLAANSLLLIEHPHDCPENMSEDDYKDLLKENYMPMYDRLLPYSVRIEKRDGNCTVSVFDHQTLILTDWLCTEGYIDCWSYNGECNLDTLKVTCGR
jgi:hypothetical protein